MPHNSRGAALIEAAITIPLLLLFLFSVIDFAGYLSQHVTASRLAYEGARYAATVPGLEIGGVACSSYIQEGKALIHGQVCERMKRVFESSGLDYASGIGVFSRRTATSTDELGTVNQSVVEIEIFLPYRPLFLKVPLLSSAHVTIEAPYLLRGN